MQRQAPNHACSKHFDAYLRESVSSVLTKKGITTTVIEPVYYYQIVEEVTSIPINYVLVYYGDEYYANVAYKCLNDKPVVTTVETGLRLNDLEAKINKLNTRIDTNTHDHTMAVQRLENIETNISNLHNQLNSHRDEKINIVLPPQPVAAKTKMNQKKKCLLISICITVCLLLAALIVGIIAGLLIFYYRFDYKSIVNPCAKNLCLNGATCQSNGDNYVCICPNGYSGNNCQNTPCSSNPCSNSSICQTGPNGAFQCVCPSGYSGPLCQIYNPCFNYPCQNKATCQTNGNNYLCICPQFFSGRNCEIYDPCCNSPCLNGATCQPSGGSYVCICPNGYSGLNCETYQNPCLSNPCFNGATCKLSGFSYVCVCPAGYSGANCQMHCSTCLK